MSMTPERPLEEAVRLELQSMRNHWLLLLLLGIGLTLVGCLAMISSFIATLATVAFFGTFLLIGSVLQVVNAVTCREWRGFIINLLIGILYGVVGLMMWNHPVATAIALTLLLAAILMIGGIARIVVAAVEHFQGWPWVMLNGFISLILGVFIWRHFPEDFSIIGLFVGIDMIFCGWSWIILALGIRSAFPQKT